MVIRKYKNLNCCEKCQNYWSCETKWYRGEHNRENICCSFCNFYEACLEKTPNLVRKRTAKKT